MNDALSVSRRGPRGAAGTRGLDGVLGTLSVLDRDRTVPPADPVEGQRHLVASGAAGLWAGYANYLVEFLDGVWVPYPPRLGWIAWIESEEGPFAYYGPALGWVEFSAMPPAVAAGEVPLKLSSAPFDWGSTAMPIIEPLSFTPTLAATTPGTHTYADRRGRGFKIGPLVFITECYVALSALDGAMAGTAVWLAGLPYACKADAAPIANVFGSTIDLAGSDRVLYGQFGGTNLIIGVYGDNIANAFLTPAALANASALYATGFYATE